MSQQSEWHPMPRFLLRKDAIKQALKSHDLSEKNLLEIGFGSGEMLKWSISQGAISNGLDFSDDAHQLANTHIKDLIQQKKCRLFNSVNQIKNEKFDYVFAFEVLEHIVEDKAAIKQWLDLLNNSGELILSVPAHQTKWGENDVWAGHVKRYEKDEFRALFDGFGVEILKIWNYGYPISKVLDLMLNKGASKKTKHETLEDDIAKTKRSGVVRSQSKLVKLLSNQYILYPFFLLQRIFFTSDRGSGYIVHVKKRP